MINVNSLFVPEPPWIIQTDMDDDIVLSELKKKYGEQVKKNYFVLNGNKMHDFDGLFTEFSIGLKFPDYFGRNFNALDECMADLEWLNLNTYIIFIKNASEILEKNTNRDFDALIKLLDNVAYEWSKPVKLGEEWDRDPVPFHVILQVTDQVKRDQEKRGRRGIKKRIVPIAV
ncbi:MAG: barstar family protein [Candidatus Thiodiazotropha sp. (ex Myrtea sp. 'scaly one' KF741663)]|nr:barstar family protein [Candidatus Thiodiazotropha sp. (ex Myrtea sp. 'scaly one' KF741663)]